MRHQVTTIERDGNTYAVYTCLFCEGRHEIKVDPARLQSWFAGVLIQLALPELTANQRNELMTCICNTCWDTMYPEGEEDDDE